LVGDAIHDAVGEGEAIDSLGKTPIVDQAERATETRLRG